MPEDMAAQVVNIFKHVAAAVAHEGGSPEDILKISFWVGDPSTGRGALNGEWEAMFPDENARPARHTHTLNASGPAKVTCEFTAVFSD